MKEYGTLDLSFLLRPARPGEPEIVALGVTALILLAAFLMGKAIVPSVVLAIAMGVLQRAIWFAICNIYARRARRANDSERQEEAA